MAKVLIAITMSLDGYINDDSSSMEPLYPDFECMGNRPVHLERIQVMEQPVGRTILSFPVLSEQKT